MRNQIARWLRRLASRVERPEGAIRPGVGRSGDFQGYPGDTAVIEWEGHPELHWLST